LTDNRQLTSNLCNLWNLRNLRNLRFYLSRTVNFPTTNSSISNRLIFAFPTANAPIATAPTASAPTAKAPTATAPMAAATIAKRLTALFFFNPNMTFSFSVTLLTSPLLLPLTCETCATLQPAKP
jgi:hypothetical protein